MKRLLSRFIVVCCLFSSSTGAETRLPIEHESKRLMLALEQSIHETDWSNASDLLKQLDSLDRDLPNEYRFLKGVVLSEQGDMKLAQESLEDYVIEGGQAADSYQEALLLITKVRGRLTAQEGLEVTEKPTALLQLPALRSEKSDGYIRALQALYLTDDPKFALIQQINSLLAAHPYTGSRLKQSEMNSSRSFRISNVDDEIVVQTKSIENGHPSLTVEKVNVSGIDPYLRYTCEAGMHACWISHPTNVHVHWLLVDKDEMVASELNDALVYLIRLIQKGA